MLDGIISRLLACLPTVGPIRPKGVILQSHDECHTLSMLMTMCGRVNSMWQQTLCLAPSRGISSTSISHVRLKPARQEGRLLALGLHLPALGLEAKSLPRPGAETKAQDLRSECLQEKQSFVQRPSPSKHASGS